MRQINYIWLSQTAWNSPSQDLFVQNLQLCSTSSAAVQLLLQSLTTLMTLSWLKQTRGNCLKTWFKKSSPHLGNLFICTRWEITKKWRQVVLQISKVKKEIQLSSTLEKKNMPSSGSAAVEPTPEFNWMLAEPVKALPLIWSEFSCLNVSCENGQEGMCWK